MRSLRQIVPRSAPSLLSALALAAITSAVSCAHDPFDGRVFHAGRIAFQTGPIPATWERLSIEGPLLAFKDHDSLGSIDVYGRCGKDRDDVPLEALTNHLLIGFTEREIDPQLKLEMDGREALHSTLRAKLDGVRMSLDIFVLKKDGCVYDLVYVAYPDRYARGVQGFEAFVSGFATVEG